MNINFILFIVAVLLLLGSFLAADHASGHMPFSGYAEERLWGRVSLGLMIAATICVGFALFV
jgi:hypothetical protein